MRIAFNKIRRNADASLFGDVLGVVSLAVMLVASLHLPTVF